MSYEGRVQYWCKQGHYWTQGCWDDEPTKCAFCSSLVVRRNGVDDTNGEADGYIEPVIATEAVFCHCGECGNKHVKKRATYVIPPLAATPQ